MQGKLILLLKEHNLTQKWLAELIGISDKQLGKKISGEVAFNSDEMFKISKYFDMSIDDVFLPRMYENGTKID